MPPSDLPGRVREAAWVSAPFVITLLILATTDGLLHAARVPASYVDVAVQLTALLLLKDQIARLESQLIPDLNA